VSDFWNQYIDDLVDGGPVKRKLKVVAACGNGTAGAFAPQVLERIGCEVIPLDVELDFTRSRATIRTRKTWRCCMPCAMPCWRPARMSALGFDGDGDRCGVVDNEGNEIFADKVGVMLARTISSEHANAKFVVDVKSTGLFMTDPVLQANGARTDYWKTGHSYIKRRVPNLVPSRASRSPATSSSTLSAAAMTTAWPHGDRGLRMLDRNPTNRWPTLSRPAADLGLADHVAALRRRGEIRHHR
jgi:phosphomannomutase/phosphoglucomutase